MLRFYIDFVTARTSLQLAAGDAFERVGLFLHEDIAVTSPGRIAGIASRSQPGLEHKL
jgi:hypothetical protein